MIEVIMQLVAAFIMVFTFGIMFQAPKRSLWFVGLTGIISWAGFLIAHATIGNLVISSFIATTIVAVCGEIFARILYLPVTVFVIAGIIPLVPGIAVYDTMLYMIRGMYIEGLQSGIDTVMIAGAIAFAVAIVGAIAKSLKARQGKNTTRGKKTEVK